MVQLLSKNYSQTVKTKGSYVVTEPQKKALFPGLMKLFKDAIKERPQLYSRAAFADAARDKDFNDALDAFFQWYDGFESLKEILNTPQARAAKERLCSFDRICVDRETILKTAKAFVAHFRTKIDDMNQSQHDLDRYFHGRIP